MRSEVEGERGWSMSEKSDLRLNIVEGCRSWEGLVWGWEVAVQDMPCCTVSTSLINTTQFITHSTVQHTTAKYSTTFTTPRHTTPHHTTPHHNIVQWCPGQHTTPHHKTIQDTNDSIVQHTTPQYSITVPASFKKTASVFLAHALARRVFPVPGGP